MTEKQTEEGLTLYRKVQAAIAAMIESHRLDVGAALPSEKELEQTYGVSRITIRRALEELEREGQVVRSKGRSARVAQPLRAHARTQLADDFMAMLDLLRGTLSEMLCYEWQLPDNNLYSLLELTSREPVLRVDRLHRKNGWPSLHTTAYVPAHIGVKLDKDVLAQTTMIEALAQHGIIPVNVEQYMSAVPCSADLAPHLGIRVGAPVFQISRIVRNASRNVIQSVTMSFRGDSFTFHLSAHYNECHSGMQVSSTAFVQPAKDGNAAAKRPPIGRKRGLNSKSRVSRQPATTCQAEQQGRTKLTSHGSEHEQ